MHSAAMKGAIIGGENAARQTAGDSDWTAPIRLDRDLPADASRCPTNGYGASLMRFPDVKKRFGNPCMIQLAAAYSTCWSLLLGERHISLETFRLTSALQGPTTQGGSFDPP